MSYILKNVVINKVLCFISSSRNSLSTEDIISTTVVYYNKEEIEQAKKFLFKLCGEKPIARASCVSWPDPCTAHVNDMIEFFERHELKNFAFPRFLADGFDSLPPTGLSRIAESIRGLRDEVSLLRTELNEHRKERMEDIKCLNDINSVQSDVADIKNAVVDLKKCNDMNNTTSSGLTMAQVVKKNLPQSFGKPSGTLATNLNPRPPPPRKNTGVFGTKKMPLTSKFAATSRNLDVFISRFQSGVESNDIVSYCSDEGITVEKCEKMSKDSASFKSFKITVSADKRDLLLEPSFWPEGIAARKFFNARSKQTGTSSGNLNSSPATP